MRVEPEDGTLSRAEIMLHRVALWSVCLAVALSAWLFGSVEPWAYYLVGTIVIIGAAAWLVSVVGNPRGNMREPVLTCALVVLLCFVFLQAVLLPSWLVRFVNPESWHVTECWAAIFGRLGFLSQTAGGIVEGQWAALSVARGTTLTSAYLFGIYLLVFVVAANTVDTWRGLRRIAGVVVACGFVLAIVSVAHKMSGVQELLWVHTPRCGGDFLGPFTNRNHFAMNMAMVFSLAVGLFLASTSFHEMYVMPDWRERLLWLSTKKASRLALLAFVIAVIGGSVFFSLSRGGMMSLLVAAGSASLISAATGRTGRGQAKIIMALVLAALTVVIWLAWEPFFDRIASLLDFAEVSKDRIGRLVVAQDATLVMGGFPLAGCGFGAFQHAFPVFARSSLLGGRWTHAHNDWAELLAEGGFLGGLIAAICLFLFVKCVISIYADADRKPRRFVLGCLMGIIAVGLHSFVDYGLHRPANALLLAMLCGLSLSALHLRRAPPRKGAGEEASAAGGVETSSGEHFPRVNTVRTGMVRFFAYAALILVTILLTSSMSCVRSALAFKRFEYMERLCERAKDVELICAVVPGAQLEAGTVLQNNTCEPDALRNISSVFFEWAVDRRLPLSGRLHLAEQSLEFAVECVRVAPSDYLCWLWLGRALALNGRWEDAELCRNRAHELKPQDHQAILFGQNR